MCKVSHKGNQWAPCSRLAICLGINTSDRGVGVEDGEEDGMETSVRLQYNQYSSFVGLSWTLIEHIMKMTPIQRRLEGITSTILSDDVMRQSGAERSSVATPRVILCKFSGFLK